VIKISLSVVNLLTPKAGAKHELLFNKPACVADLLNIQVGLKRHISVTKIIPLTFMNLVTPKGQTKYKLLFNKLASVAGWLNIQVRLKRHISATKFKAIGFNA
jgi:hypothetical protein